MPFKPKYGLSFPGGDGYAMAVFGRWPEEVDFPGAQALHGRIVNDWRDTWNQRARVMADETMMPLARIKAAQQFAAGKLHRINREIAPAIGEYIDKMAAANKRLKRKTGAPDESGQAQVDAEIRAHLRSLNSDERMKVVHEAGAAGDDTVLRAVASAPGFLSGLAEPLHARAYETYAQRVAGEDFHQVRTYGTAVDVLTKAQRELREHITSLADFGSDWEEEFPPPPPVVIYDGALRR